MTDIKFEFSIGDKILIKGTDIRGTIIGLYYAETGCQYQVSYFWEGDNKRTYFYGFDLELIEGSRMKGFGLLK